MEELKTILIISLILSIVVMVINNLDASKKVDECTQRCQELQETVRNQQLLIEFLKEERR
ncbi:hypothetical protein J6U78_03680 [bacterium]|nr:hypothetical protein [bacterium]